jgi:hypothetical protein
MFRGCSTGPRQGQRLEFKRVRQTGNRAGGTSASKAGAHRPLLCAGSGAAVAARRYWRLWWTASASPGPATGRPTGSRWAKRKGEAGWTAVTKRMAPLASCCSSIPSAATSSRRSGRPNRPGPVQVEPDWLDKVPRGGQPFRKSGGQGHAESRSPLRSFQASAIAPELASTWHRSSERNQEIVASGPAQSDLAFDFPTIVASRDGIVAVETLEP